MNIKIINNRVLKIVCILSGVIFCFSCKSTNGSFLRTNSTKTSSYLVSSLDERSSVHKELGVSNINSLKEELTSTIKERPKDLNLRLSLAKIDFVDGKYNEVIEQCRSILVYDNKNIEAKKILASTYYATGNYDMASIIINGLDADSKKDSVVLNIEALIALKDGNRHLALSKFNEALKTDPNNVATRMNLGMLYIKHRMFRQAGIQFDRVLSLMPDNDDAKLHLAIVNSGLEKSDNSQIVSTYKSILSKDPENSIAWFNLASIQTRNKEYSDAQKSLDNYLDTPYVKSHKEHYAFDLLAKIQKLQTMDENQDLKIANKNNESIDSSENSQKVVDDNPEVIDEISNLEQELETK